MYFVQLSPIFSCPVTYVNCLNVKIFRVYYMRYVSKSLATNIQNFKIHHESFHSLKPSTYLNDEVHMLLHSYLHFIWICLLQIVNGYLELLSSKHDSVFVINSYLVTAIITKRLSEMSKTLFHKVQHITTQLPINSYIQICTLQHKLGSKKQLMGMYNENRNHWVLVVCVYMQTSYIATQLSSNMFSVLLWHTQ